MSQYVGDLYCFHLHNDVHPETGSTLALVYHKTLKYPIMTALAATVADLSQC